MHSILRPSIHMIGYPSRGTSSFQSIEHVTPTIFKASASVDLLLRRYVFVTPTMFDLAMSLCWVGTISKPNFMLLILPLVATPVVFFVLFVDDIVPYIIDVVVSRS